MIEEQLEDSKPPVWSAIMRVTEGKAKHSVKGRSSEVGRMSAITRASLQHQHREEMEVSDYLNVLLKKLQRLGGHLKTDLPAEDAALSDTLLVQTRTRKNYDLTPSFREY